MLTRDSIIEMLASNGDFSPKGAETLANHIDSYIGKASYEWGEYKDLAHFKSQYNASFSVQKIKTLNELSLYTEVITIEGSDSFLARRVY